MTEPAAVAARVTLERLRREVEQALHDALPPEDAWPATIHRAVRYSLLAGGKRVRPLLALAAGGPDADVMPFAVALEMIHTYSLVHDDLPAMDDDDLRRGRPTSHKVFGEAIAILAGDALLTRAFQLLADLPRDWDADRVRRRVDATAVLAEACGTSGLIGGQVEDLESEGRAVSAEALERLHRAKTGALLRASVVGGGILGGAGPDELAALEAYASAIGLAFQVVDDVLDATEGAAQLGKTAGKDAAADKATYVKIHGLEASRTLATRLLADALAALEPLGGRSSLLAELARGIVERRA